MRILTVCGTPKKSGNILRTYYITKELSNLGHEIDNISSVRQMPFQFNFIYSIPLYLFQTFNNDKIYDLIFVSKPYFNASIVAFLKKIQGSKIVADIDDLTFMYHEGGISRSILKFFEDILPRYFDFVCIHNKRVSDYMMKHGLSEEKIYYLPNGVDLSLFNPELYDGKIYRKKLGLKDEKIILYLANLGISSELETILKTVRNILSKKIKLVVVGTGPLINYYKKLVNKMGIKNYVIFTGYVPLKDVPGYISMADCCVVYYSDNLANYYRTSMKLREYLVMGKPVVCNVLGDLYNFKDYTYNFYTEDLDEFKDKILQVLSEKIDKKRISNGQKYIRENLSWEKIVKNFDVKLKNIVR